MKRRIAPTSLQLWYPFLYFWKDSPRTSEFEYPFFAAVPLLPFYHLSVRILISGVNTLELRRSSPLPPILVTLLLKIPSFMIPR